MIISRQFNYKARNEPGREVGYIEEKGHLLNLNVHN